MAQQPRQLESLYLDLTLVLDAPQPSATLRARVTPRAKRGMHE